MSQHESATLLAPALRGWCTAGILYLPLNRICTPIDYSGW
jgi:hypothetical protein